MKNIVLLTLLALPLLAIAQRRPKIKGNRSVIEVRETLPPFSSVELLDDLKVQLVNSQEPGYTILADDNLIEVLKLEVEDETLRIRSFYDITAKKKLEITVGVGELKSITLRQGKIFGSSFIETDKIQINSFSNSDIKLDVKGFRAVVNVEDNSKAELNLDVDSLDVRVRHKADASIYAVTGANKVTLSDTANLNLEGSTQDCVVDMTNNSKLKAEKLEAGNVTLSILESGFAKVNAVDRFVLSSNGNSKTQLYGNPKIEITDFLDTSQLMKK